MRVQCNQCGRMFEVPQSQANRALKCVCKNIFIATPLLEEVKGPAEAKVPTSPNSVPLTHTQTNTPDQPEDHLSEPTVTSRAASEEELDDYIKFLKGTKAPAESVNTSAPDLTPTAPAPKTEIGPVDSNWARSSSLFDSLPQEMSAEEKNPEKLPMHQERPLPLQGRITNPERKNLTRPKFEVQKPRHRSSAIYISCGATAIGAVVAAIFWLSAPKKVAEETVDPYLSRLLESKTERKAPEPQPQPQPSAVATQSMPPPTSPSLSPATNQRDEPSNLVLKTELEDSDLYPKFILGEFENIVRVANKRNAMSVIDRALLLEALAQRAGSDRTRLFKLLDDTKSYKEVSGSSPHLIRTESAVRIFLANNETDLNKPIEYLKSLTRTQPHDPLVYAYLGLALHRLNRQELAEQAWNQALAIEPGFFWLLQIRKDLAIKEKNWRLADNLARQVIKIEGYEAYGYREISRIFALQKKTEEAIDALKKAAQIYPTSSTFIALGKLQADRNVSAAAQNFEKALKQKPTKNEIEEASLGLARLLCENEKGEQASAYYRMYLNENMSKSVIIEKAECEIQSGFAKRAIETYESALKLDPRDPQMWLRYANVLYRTDKFRAALEAAQTSLRWKESEGAHILAARTLSKLRNAKEAHKHLQKVLHANPQNREASALMKSLN